MNAKPISPAQISRALAELPGWSFDNNTLLKSFNLGSFRAAIAFMHRASYVADAMDHHPLWTNLYDTVTVRLSTHDAGNQVTERDLELAQKLERLSRTS